MDNCHFSGWATRNDILCSDGRTIRQNAFKNDHGRTVPLIWNHDHQSQNAVLGHAKLENRDEGVYAYCTFNTDTEQGKHAKSLVEHGDVRSLSIYANKLKQIGNDVIHGSIKELSLVLAGANQGAYIDFVMAHDEDGEDSVYVNYDESAIVIYHSDEKPETNTETKKEDKPMAEEAKKPEGDKTVKEVWDGLMKKVTPEEEAVIYAMIGTAAEEGVADENDAEHSDFYDDEGGNELMHHNIFENQVNTQNQNVLSHADQKAIISMAKQSNVGSFKQALQIFAEENDMLQHSEDGVGIFENYGVLFPELELLKKGEPETIYKHDQSWVATALAKIHKSPYSRIRTRHADARVAELKAKGYQNKGDQKTIMGQIKMINRETTPQTIYIKDSMHRDDEVDIIDFNIVDYQWKQMRVVMNETMVLSAMVGDGRDDLDPDKIKEEHIRPIWKDNEEYTIHQDVDIEAAKKELQGTNTGANFGENYIYAEAVITAALYSREQFKGTGTPDFYCTPHMVNVMLLARDLNGRRIYDSKADLAKALNANSIIEVQQFEGLTRTTEDGKKKKLLGLFVNLNDYTFGSTKGGEITRFEDFDMDFNLKKFMLEARLSGSLYKLKSAIALEEPVVEAAG
jgi:hypothetical protein